MEKGRKKRSQGEKRKYFFNERRERSLLKNIYIYIYILTIAPLLQHAF